VDPETDAFLTKMIGQIFTSVTTITIAHRLQTIMGADQILVIDKGRVAEQGESQCSPVLGQL
jgi:ABC-type multidrug transport system fused ATPase/permease subunit